MKFRGRSFEHLFVVRAQETTLPQRRVDDPLLPDSERRQLGVREIGDGRDEERLLFQLLLDGASTSVRFSSALHGWWLGLLLPLTGWARISNGFPIGTERLSLARVTGMTSHWIVPTLRLGKVG